ncbi:MAG: hypothetical protein R2694_14125 [Ilumatobacteraceae bacterium]
MPTSESTHLRRRASELRRFAQTLDTLRVHDLRLRTGPTTWLGPSPSACDADVRAIATGLHAAADELRRTAARLERRAADLDAAARAAALAGIN